MISYRTSNRWYKLSTRYLQSSKRQISFTKALPNDLFMKHATKLGLVLMSPMQFTYHMSAESLSSNNKLHQQIWNYHMGKRYWSPWIHPKCYTLPTHLLILILILIRTYPATYTYTYSSNYSFYSFTYTYTYTYTKGVISIKERSKTPKCEGKQGRIRTSRRRECVEGYNKRGGEVIVSWRKEGRMLNGGFSVLFFDFSLSCMVVTPKGRWRSSVWEVKEQGWKSSVGAV